MGEPMYDVIVVGAGIEGSATACQLSRRGAKVLLLEQFLLPHSRGSSHGATRILRKAYPFPFYTDMMEYNLPEWNRLQQESGVTLFRNTGYLNIGPLSDAGIRSDIECLTRSKAKFDVLSPEKFRKRFPNVTYDDDVGALFDLEGGVMFADKALQAYQTMFAKFGGELRDGEALEQIDPGEIIHVTTSKQSYRCKSLILCCGPWTNKALKSVDLHLPLSPLRLSVCFWPEKVKGSYTSKHMPTFSDRRKTNITFPYTVYGLPSDEHPGLFKLVLHHGPEADPDRRDAVDSQWVISLMKIYVRKHFPGLVPEPSIVEPCYYTNTPDKNFILDSHPQWKNILIGAGFSGHGFKHAPAVGSILADLAQGCQPKFDIRPFKIGRFKSAPQQSKL